MKIMPLGDYYVWYCEWCDTRNLTLWTRFEKNDVFCGACHRGAQLDARGTAAHVTRNAVSALL